MPAYEERLILLEETSVTRLDFLNAVSKLTLQQAQNAKDFYHEITILIGVVGSQGQDIKTFKADVASIQADVKSITEDVTGIQADVKSIQGRLDEHTSLLTQILARLPEKS